MIRIEHSRETWRAIARELSAPGHAPAPAGLAERIAAMLAESPGAWTGQACVLELDDDAARSVQAAHRRLALPAPAPAPTRESEAVADAMEIVRRHQHRDDRPA